MHLNHGANCCIITPAGKFMLRRPTDNGSGVLCVRMDGLVPVLLPRIFWFCLAYFSIMMVYALSTLYLDAHSRQMRHRIDVDRVSPHQLLV